MRVLKRVPGHGGALEPLSGLRRHGGAAGAGIAVRHAGATTVATISDSVSGLVFTGAGGKVLSGAETAALIGIFEEAVAVASELGDAVYRPAGIVFN